MNMESLAARGTEEAGESSRRKPTEVMAQEILCEYKTCKALPEAKVTLPDNCYMENKISFFLPLLQDKTNVARDKYCNISFNVLLKNKIILHNS
jgi:hypothetical protein